jgi:hypothetical protein
LRRRAGAGCAPSCDEKEETGNVGAETGKMGADLRVRPYQVRAEKIRPYYGEE